MQIDRGGATGRMLFFKQDDITVCVENRQFEQELKHALQATGNPDLVAWAQQDTVQRGRRRLVIYSP